MAEDQTKPNGESQAAQIAQQEHQAAEHFKHLIEVAYRCVPTGSIPSEDHSKLAIELFRHFLENERIVSNAQMQQNLLVKQQEMINRSRLSEGFIPPFRKGH